MAASLFIHVVKWPSNGINDLQEEGCCFVLFGDSIGVVCHLLGACSLRVGFPCRSLDSTTRLSRRYQHQWVGRTARCEEDGKALLFLLPWVKEGILEALQKRRLVSPQTKSILRNWSFQSCLYQRSKLGSHRPKPISNVAQWLREASTVHALPKRETLGSTLPTHWGQSALLTSTVGSILTIPTSQ